MNSSHNDFDDAQTSVSEVWKLEAARLQEAVRNARAKLDDAHLALNGFYTAQLEPGAKLEKKVEKSVAGQRNCRRKWKRWS